MEAPRKRTVMAVDESFILKCEWLKGRYLIDGNRADDEREETVASN